MEVTPYMETADTVQLLALATISISQTWPTITQIAISISHIATTPKIENTSMEPNHTHHFLDRLMESIQPGFNNGKFIRLNSHEINS